MKIINIHIGEIKRGETNSSLRSILGSCVGIALIWKARQQSIMAHCLLPGNGKIEAQISGRCVDQAIHSMLMLLRAKPQHYCEIEAIIAGGGNMTNPHADKNAQLIGDLNVKACLNLLNNLGIKIVYSECGGNEGRKLTLNCDSLDYKIEKIPRMNAIA